MKLEKRIIHSYGLLSASSLYCKPETEEQIAEYIEYAKQHHLSICPYGGGMSFSDVCLIDDQISLDIKGLSQIIKFDPEKGIITAQAGALTTDILALVMPHGWYLCGLSGSLHNTLAGDISNNINGKDSWKYGNFGANVISMKVFLADGTGKEISASVQPELFNAVIGGMGLMGIITEVTLQLIRIPSYIIENRSEQLPDLHSLMNKMDSLNENEVSFVYAWTDAFSQGTSFGRSILETARFVPHENISTEEFKKGWSEKKSIGFLPPVVFWKLFNMVESQTSFRLANNIKYNFFGEEKKRTMSFQEYQYPMIKHFPQWNLKYVPKGFHEFQPVFPAANFENAFVALLAICREYKFLPQICSIRKHKSEPYYLSFSENGYSFTINYPLKDLTAETLKTFTQKLVDTTLKHKGKIYLGKYPYVSAAECREMYPHYDSFINTKKKYDPTGIFSSNAARRLFA